MAIDKETEAKILRYHVVEHWGVHTLAAQLNIHHSTVDRVLAQAGLPKVERATRPTIIDDYLPFVVNTLANYPTLTAARLYGMAQERGYLGGPSYFRQRVAEVRPRKSPEAFLRLKTLPGEHDCRDAGGTPPGKEVVQPQGWGRYDPRDGGGRVESGTETESRVRNTTPGMEEVELRLEQQPRDREPRLERRPRATHDCKEAGGRTNQETESRSQSRGAS